MVVIVLYLLLSYVCYCLKFVVVLCLLLFMFVVVLCLLLFCACYCFMLFVVLCLLWSVKGLQMHISCVATICSRASNGDIYVLSVRGPY